METRIHKNKSREPEMKNKKASTTKALILPLFP